jgi:hypothetical protein
MNFSTGITRVRVGFRRKYLPNISPRRYCYTRLLGNIISIIFTEVEEEALGEGRREGENGKEEDFSSIMWDIIPFSPLKVNGNFLRTCLYLQGRSMSQARKQSDAGSKLGVISQKRELFINITVNASNRTRTQEEFSIENALILCAEIWYGEMFTQAAE